MVVHGCVPCTLLPLFDDGLGNCLQVVSEAHLGPEIDHAGGQVEEIGHFSRLVVHREGMVVVVPALSSGAETHEDVLTRVDGLIVGSLPPEMCGAVDEPGGVQGPAVPHEGAHEERVVEGLTPVEHRHGRRDEETDHEDQLQVMSSLELKDWFRLEITKINILSLLLDVRVLFDHQPTHVGEEESSASVVGVSLGLRVLVMYTVVSGPLNKIILESDAVAEHKEDLERCFGLV